jgi:hypothetical protein
MFGPGFCRSARVLLNSAGAKITGVYPRDSEAKMDINEDQLRLTLPPNLKISKAFFSLKNPTIWKKNETGSNGLLITIRVKIP